MSDAADFGVCPRCGSGLYSGGVATSVRTCRECGAKYRPASSGLERGLVAAVIIGPSVLGLGVAVAGLVLAIAAPPKDNGAVVMGLMCFGIFGTASTGGVFLGVRELRRRPGAILFDPGNSPGRAVPTDRAAEIVRYFAQAHRAGHIVKQLDGIRPDRVARARARFARAMTDVPAERPGRVPAH
jgi:hypothetical protein